MTKTEIQMKQQNELNTKLREISNTLRGPQYSSDYKDYILGVIFYKYLSERTEKYMEKLLKEDGVTYEEAWGIDEYKEGLIEEALDTLGFVVEPQYLFNRFVAEVNNGTFMIEHFHKAINSVEDSTKGNASQEAFDGLFEDMDLTSSKLGREVKDRGERIGGVISLINEISFGQDDTAIDILGHVYMYMIGMYAENAGKNGGEFFTPHSMTELVSRIATHGRPDILKVSDSTCGSGGLLLETSKHSNVRMFRGAELNRTTYNLCRMNLIVHNVPYANFNIANTDTIRNPAHLEEKFDVQVGNPPYSLTYSGDASFLEDPRFAPYGKLAPKSKADFAFVQHMVYQMTDDGIAVVLLPHGVLFRGGAEGSIREYLIKELNVVDTIIGLPAGCFMGTGIPVACLVLKKNRKDTDDIFFIDASKEFTPGKPINTLSGAHLDKIVDTYITREDVSMYAKKTSMEEIAENDYNLNIPRYVDTFEAEEVIDIDLIKCEIAELEEEVSEFKNNLAGFLAELGI